MPSNALIVSRRITAWRDATLSPAALSANLAMIARRARDDLIATGEAAPAYDTFVDGRRGAPEETVRPEGAIVYRFNLLGQAAKFALAFCINRSPVADGDFKRSWFVLVDGARWSADLNDIPSGGEVAVTNPRPYARKIESGHMRMSVPHGIIEDARQAVRSRFPTILGQKTYLLIPASLGGGYVLKGRFRRGHREHARTRVRSDTAAGAQLTYPALILTAR